MSKQEVRNEIQKLQQQITKVKGTPCEVYSRVCGYLRPTASWNKGKQEEFTLRKTFNCCSNPD